MTTPTTSADRPPDDDSADDRAPGARSPSGWLAPFGSVTGLLSVVASGIASSAGALRGLLQDGQLEPSGNSLLHSGHIMLITRLRFWIELEYD